MRGLAGSSAAKVRHLFGLCKDFGRKVRKWRWLLTDVGCFEMQNAASANQSWASTNHIGRFGGLDVISQRDLSPVLTKMWEVDAKLRKEREMGKVVEKEKMG